MSNLLLELAADALDADVEVAFLTGGVVARPHPLLLPLHSDLPPLHLLNREVEKNDMSVYERSDQQVECTDDGVPSLPTFHSNKCVFPSIFHVHPHLKGT